MTAVPVTRTWVAGEVVTDSHFNTNIRDVFNYLLARPVAELQQITTGQDIGNGAWTAVTFNSEVVDSSGAHSNSTNTSRFTAVYPGYYRPGGGVPFPGNATGVRGTRFAVNAAALNSSVFLVAGFAGGSGPNLGTRDKLAFLNVNDYLEVQCFQNSGGSLTLAVTADESASFTNVWESN